MIFTAVFTIEFVLKLFAFRIKVSDTCNLTNGFVQVVAVCVRLFDEFLANICHVA